MENCFERIVELLGKLPGDPLFVQFTKDIGDTPDLFLDTEKAVWYHFKNSGIYLNYLRTVGYFGLVIFESMDCYPPEQRYRGNFPGGIQFGDDRETVRKKLDSIPDSFEVADKETWEEYRMGPLTLTLAFHSRSNKLTSVFLAYKA